jgi:uncharacterized protein YcaQ
VRAPTLRALAAHAVARSLQTAPSLADAIAQQGFVQLDPIRAPARAADLILRHRVDRYRAGDLDRAYPSLPLAEDYLHVYGVLPLPVQRLLHPRSPRHRRGIEREHPRLARRVLDHVARSGETHPRDLAPILGHVRIVGGWGGETAATAHMLEALHHRGKLRVVRRANGVKVYDVALPAPPVPGLAPAARAHGILLALLHLYSPLPVASFRQLARMVTESSLAPKLRATALDVLLAGPDVERIAIAGDAWLKRADEPLRDDVDARVRLLAPFDPVVWDRRRFAAFWGWEYRLEAYTPPAKRKLGYYALPLLWCADVVGWANAQVAERTLVVDVRYAKAPPRGAAFRRALEGEVERLRECVVAERVQLRVDTR